MTDAEADAAAERFAREAVGMAGPEEGMCIIAQALFFVAVDAFGLEEGVVAMDAILRGLQQHFTAHIASLRTIQ